MANDQAPPYPISTTECLQWECGDVGVWGCGIVMYLDILRLFTADLTSLVFHQYKSWLSVGWIAVFSLAF